jgi:hypothetical protein
MVSCAHCQVEITDETTQVVHGARTYCCPNCAAAMEESGSGSDPATLSHPDALRCSHCGCAIIDESTMQTRGDEVYCCSSCAMTAAARAG